ncbi:MAG: murein biosynthesis integral membrane protein MurJ [Rubellimicrobium sp.]|nr:murein biosynthesis integral membrane protein MurJ [Rubellimicrobium sp.]
MARPIRLIRGAVTVGLWTLLSRGAGFVRDVMIAGYLGTGAMADAFNVAFALPNMFRRFFAEGAFNMAFVPLYARRIDSGEDPATFARDALAGLGTVLVLFSLLGTLLMPWLVWAMASGFAGDARFDLAVDYGRITFVYILFISLVALLSGILNSHGQFTEAGMVPVLMNLMFIGAMLLADRAGWNMGLTLAWTTPVTGIVQLGFTWVAAARLGLAPAIARPRLTPEVKRLLVIAGPVVLSGGIVQINMIVGRQIASYTEGAVSWLVYADRLYQLPLGVVGIAVGTVLLPELARRLGAGDSPGGREALNRAAEFALLLTLPAAVALVVIAHPLVSVLYGRGAFGAADAEATALALAIYGAGLPAFMLHKVLQPLFYAREDTRSPFRYALVSMGLNVAIALGLGAVVGWSAAAWGTTLSAWAMAALLWRGSRRMGEAARIDARLRARLWRIALAAAIMGAVLWALALGLGGWLDQAGMRYGALALLVGIGAAVYFAAGAALGAFRPGDIGRILRRKRG